MSMRVLKKMVKLNKMELLKRKQIRLKGYNYSQSGCYFVTICTQDRKMLFGNIVGVGRDRPDNAKPEMVLNGMGKIVQSVWQSLPKHHTVELDQFQIMPNHVHMIIIITCALRSTGASRRAPTEYKPTLGFIVGLFKSEITKQIRVITGNPEFMVWQRNYYEHVIRDEFELNKIRGYIKTNPEMWDRDRNNPKFSAPTISHYIPCHHYQFLLLSLLQILR